MLAPGRSLQGWFVGAMADHDPGFSGMCGRCLEIRCASRDFTDGYDNRIDRKGVCLDPGRSVVIKLSDDCPCNYAANYYSNRRCENLEPAAAAAVLVVTGGLHGKRIWGACT